MTDRHYIWQAVGTEELLGQLEEECAELIQAASKLRRAISGKNPTPVTIEEAEKMITEEFADVCLCAEILGYRPDSMAIGEIQEKKMLRWITRINEEKEKMLHDTSRNT